MKRFSFTRLASLMLAGVLLTGAASALNGCHGAQKKASFTVPESFDTSKDYEVVFWAKNDTNVTQAQIYKKAIADFEELYPNITVTMRLYTDYGKIYNDVITNISTDTTPNVCITYPDHIATYMTGDNVVVPLDDLFADPRYGLGGSELKYDGPAMDEMVPEFLKECRIGDTCYAIPYMRSTEALYINKTYVEKLGYEIPDIVTWDYIWEVSSKATEKDADGTYTLNGQQVMIPFIYKSTDNMMIQYLRQMDAGYSTSAGDILIFNDVTTDFLYRIAKSTGEGAFSTFKISSYPGNFFNAGQCIFAVDSTAGSTWIGSDAPLSDIAQSSIVEFETIVKPVPQVDTSNPQMISQGPSICIFNKDDPQEVLASWLFAQYMLTNGVQTAYAETEGYVPVTHKAQESAEYKEYLSRAGEDNTTYYQVKMDATNLLLGNVSNTFTTPVFNGSASLRDAAGSLIESVAKSINRKQTVDDEYIGKLYTDASALYHLDSINRSATSSDLGVLPAGAKALLIILGVAWTLIIAYFILKKISSYKKR